jgi:hypothetical protein
MDLVMTAVALERPITRRVPFERRQGDIMVVGEL